MMPLPAVEEETMAEEKAKKAARDVFERKVKELKIHPAHEGIPDIAEEPFKSLVASVKLNGVMEPVELLSKADAEARDEKNAESVLDGRQRIRAAKECELATVPAVYAVIPAEMSTSEYVYLKAAQRRHLNPSQRAILAVTLKQWLEGQAGQGKKSQLLADLPEGQTSRDRAGKFFAVSGRNITTAEKILAESPDLAEKVRRGDMRLNKAIRELNREAGKTSKRTAYDNSLTAFKRLFSTWKDVKPSKKKLPEEAYNAINDLMQQLEEKLADLAQGAQSQEPKQEEKG
jgi:ParB-like chromosome segregation protein Spo0J